ncbi:WD40-repeat-containing domain protein [Tribonema minus]|uniref:WD40-repeat-containing domain protein n=1 Tax=Tribonema minus TaxID=303371 RepID=A0A835YNR1_9STRA|nr:WD40-repeat-containing domain protein [Tribonema minus]
MSLEKPPSAGDAETEPATEAANRLATRWRDQSRRKQLLGHKGRVFDFQFHPTVHSRAASCSEDGTVRVWDVQRGVSIASAKGSKDEVLRICWAPPGTPGIDLASGSADGLVRLWAMSAATSTATRGAPGRDGSSAAALRCVKTLDVKAAAGGDGQVYALQFIGADGGGSSSGISGSGSSNGSSGGSGSGSSGSGSSGSSGSGGNLMVAADDAVSLWDVGTGVVTRRWAFSSSAQHAHGGAARNPDNQVFVFDAKVCCGSGGSGGGDGTLAAALSDGTVRVQPLDSELPASTLHPCGSGSNSGGGGGSSGGGGGAAHLTAVAWAPDGSALAACGGGGGVEVWDARTWTRRAALQAQALAVSVRERLRCAANTQYGDHLPAAAHSRPVYGVMFCASAPQLLLSWSSDGTLKAWDWGAAANDMNGGDFAPLQQRSTAAQLVDVMRITCQHREVLSSGDYPILHCALARDASSVVVAGGDSGARGAAMTGVPVLSSGDYPILHLALARDGSSVAVAGGDSGARGAAMTGVPDQPAGENCTCRSRV